MSPRGIEHCMNESEAKHKVMAVATYVYSETFMIGSMPIAYGILTLIFSDDLWARQEGQYDTELGVYDSASLVPHAPESWGVVFILLGATILFSALKGWHRTTAASAMACGFVFSFFAVTFLVDAIKSQVEPAWPPFFVYLCLAGLLVNRSRLSLAWGK